MANQIQTTCFTDLEGSTSLTEEFGHETFIEEIKEHLRVGRILAEREGGHYIKSIGDAHMITFDHLEHAINFSLRLQEYYEEQPCLRHLPIRVRVGLYLGVVEPTGSDVFGSGVNQAARVQGKAAPGQVLLNKELVDSIEKIWGTTKTVKYFNSIGEHELKGISKPPKQELFSFDWPQYGYDYPESGLVRLVYEHIRQAKVEASLLDVRDLSKPGVVIWPVVPRDIPTAIHRGQTEVVRMLARLGWRVKLLIADCARSNLDRAYSSLFSDKLTRYVSSRGISSVETLFLSDFFDPTSPDYKRVQEIFRNIASDFTLKDMLDINNKEYSDAVKDEIKGWAMLDCLRPALSLSAVLYIVEKEGMRGIVVAGADEKIQWERAFDIPNPNTRESISVLMIPILKEDSQHQTKQSRNWPSLAFAGSFA